MKSLLSPAEFALQQLGEHLLIARKSCRWTQAEVQARTGLSRVTIRRMEQDLVALNFDLPRRIRQSRKEYDNDF
ncbi:helix-turn-helix domain-containing protein [Nitrincola nitratireducens]|nr:helix-turn-helix domain-containing protein [Nitrincola nitratireducens]